MKVYILGAAGWIPGRNETSCVMVECDGELFFLDAGTGMSNLKNYLPVLAKYDTVHLLLSHYHLDHTIGLIYLDPFVRDKKLVIYGPGRMAYPESTDFYVRALLRREFFARDIDDFSKDVRILDFPEDSFRIGETKVSVKEQQHSAPSFRITLNDRLIYATDTAFDPEVGNGMSGALLLHECWDYRQTEGTRHSSLWQLKNLLPRNRFKRIILIHQNPAWTKEDYEAIQNMIADTDIEAARDGMQLDV